MHAYVFYHWPVPDIEASLYQQYLVDFHQTLEKHHRDGYFHTRALLLERAPSLNRDRETYEDWHILENAAGLDPLNERAVSGPCLEPHNRVARWTEDGAGGLYALAFGTAFLPTINFVYRLSKPAGMSYATLYDLLRPLAQDGKAAVWRRQMNLGPGPEFCLHSAEILSLPEPLTAPQVRARQLCLVGIY